MDATIPLQKEASATVLVSWRGGSRNVPLVEEGTTFGRDASCDVVIDDPSLSRRHAVLEQRGETYWIRDLGSSNGTWMGRERIQERELRPGGTARLGSVLVTLEGPESDDVESDAGRLRLLQAWSEWIPREREERRVRGELLRAKAQEQRMLLAFVEAALSQADLGCALPVATLLDEVRVLDAEIQALSDSREDLLASRGEQYSELASEKASREAPLRLFDEEKRRCERRLRAIERQRAFLAARQKRFVARSWSSADEDLQFQQLDQKSRELEREAMETRVALRDLEQGIAKARASYDEAVIKEETLRQGLEGKSTSLELQREGLQRKRLEKALAVGATFMSQVQIPELLRDHHQQAVSARRERQALEAKQEEHRRWLVRSSKVRRGSALLALVTTFLFLGWFVP